MQIVYFAGLSTAEIVFIIDSVQFQHTLVKCHPA